MIYDGIEFDSDIEINFYCWCKEACDIGLLYEYYYHEPDFTFEIAPKQHYTHYEELKTKTKEVQRVLFRPLTYTFDFLIYPTQKFEKFYHGCFYSDNLMYIDTKGIHINYGGKRYFKAMQKLMYYHYGIYINKVVPKNFFLQTFAPQRFLYTPKTQKPIKNFNQYHSKHSVQTLLEMI